MHAIKNLIFLWTTFITSTVCLSQSNFQLCSDNKLNTRLDSIVDSAVVPYFNENRKTLSISMFHKGHQSYYNYSEEGQIKHQLADSNSLFEIGSITKTFTGYLLAKAVLDKKVMLNDDIREYLKEDYPNLEFKGEPIRLFHLLNHSSGLPFDFIDRSKYENLPEDEKVYKLEPVENNYPQQKIFQELHTVKLDTFPGVNLRYSNVAAQILGTILEKVYGKSYVELVSEFITVPLEMNNTFFILPRNKQSKAMAGYSVTGKAMPHFSSGPAGGLYSSTADLLKYGKLQLNENSELIALLHTPTWGQIQYYAMGLNWQLMHKTNEPKRVWQSGSTPGFTSLISIYPELDIVVVILSNEHDENSEGDLSTIANEIVSKIKMDQD